MHPALVYGVLAASVTLIKGLAPGPWLVGLKILPVGLLAVLSWRAYRRDTSPAGLPETDGAATSGEAGGSLPTPQAREAHFWVSLGLTSSCLADGIIELSFVAGLVGFLLGHLCYIRMMGPMPFRREQLIWFGVTAAFVGTLLSLTWEKLPGDMVGPVLAYMLVIGTMIGRAGYRATQGDGTRSVVMMGVGAWLYALSDSLIGLNRWYHPLPYAPFWILSTYFMGQYFIYRSNQARPDSNVFLGS